MSRAFNNNNNNDNSSNNNVFGYEKDKSFCIKPVYYNPTIRQHYRSQSLDVDALERSGIRNVLLQVMFTI